MKVLGELMAFRGEDSYLDRDDVVYEVTDVAGGIVEIGFDLSPGRQLYCKLPFGPLCDAVARFGRDAGK